MLGSFISHYYHYVVWRGWRVMGSLSTTVAEASLMFRLLLVCVVQGRLETHVILGHFPIALFSIVLYLEYLLGLRDFFPPLLLLLIMAIVSG